MSYDNFFWLHVKKSAGITTRHLLQPYYLEVDRTNKPASFIQSTPMEYNDILNNYRMLLGEYQFRRSLFAKKYLYPNDWNKIFSFAFSREPVERCVSMFHYLYWKGKGIDKLKSAIVQSIFSKKLNFNAAYAFDVFLDRIGETHTSDFTYSPHSHHFSTHTAPMWEDVTDLNGNIILKRIFRLESLNDGINQVFEECGLDKRLPKHDLYLNKSSKSKCYNPNKNQIAKIERIYFHDFEIYEKAKHF